jgi:hypothetical protein
MSAAMPKVKAYPECSECFAPYVLRRAFTFSAKGGGGRSEWIWQRDCKHKNAAPKVHP